MEKRVFAEAEAGGLTGLAECVKSGVVVLIHFGLRRQFLMMETVKTGADKTLLQIVYLFIVSNLILLRRHFCKDGNFKLDFQWLY